MRSYNEFCSTARALDAVGDRWALLIVRELLLGPRRYTDLLDGLPGIGTNVLSTRLRELEQTGVIARRRVPSPTPALLYELTDDGRDLRSVVDALARWGARRLSRPAKADAVEPRWFALSLAANADPHELDPGTSFALNIDGEVFTLRVDDGAIVATDAVNETPTATVTGKLTDFFPASKGDRAALKRLTVSGDRRAAKVFVTAVLGAMIRTS
jgi:DNA-binding HxlR family transcriptional regulator